MGAAAFGLGRPIIEPDSTAPNPVGFQDILLETVTNHKGIRSLDLKLLQDNSEKSFPCRDAELLFKFSILCGCQSFLC